MFSECKTFLKTLEWIRAYMSTKRTHLFDDVVKRCLPKTSLARWSLSSKLLQTVGMCHFELLTVFNVIGKDKDWIGQ